MTDKELERATRALLAELERQAEDYRPDAPSLCDEGDLTRVVIAGRVDLVALAAMLGPCADGHHWVDTTVVHSNIRTDLCSRCGAKRRTKW